MEELIKQAFLHVDIIGPHVNEGHYDLMGPDGSIILPQVWETIVQPGWNVTMTMWPLPEPKPEAMPIHVPPPPPPPPPPPGYDVKKRANKKKVPDRATIVPLLHDPLRSNNGSDSDTTSAMGPNTKRRVPYMPGKFGWVMPKSKKHDEKAKIKVPGADERDDVVEKLLLKWTVN